MSEYRWNRKHTVEQCKSIDMSFLRRDGFLDSSGAQGIIWTNRFGQETASMAIITHLSGEDSYIRFMYTMVDRNTGEETDFDYNVPLVSTPCNFGGVRWWFICPPSVDGGCGRRVGVLYRAPRRDYYACRHCLELSYASRNESRRGRFGHLGYCMTLCRRMEKLREQTHRWTYDGRLARKAWRLHALTARLNAYGSEHLADFR